ILVVTWRITLARKCESSDGEHACVRPWRSILLVDETEEFLLRRGQVRFGERRQRQLSPRARAGAITLAISLRPARPASRLISHLRDAPAACARASCVIPLLPRASRKAAPS